MIFIFWAILSPALRAKDPFDFMGFFALRAQNDNFFKNGANPCITQSSSL